jgi:cell division protein FtsW
MGLATLLVSSMLDKKWVLRLSVLNVFVCLALLLITLVAPAAVKGSARWVNLGFATVMPADLLKPGFIILTAWFLTAMKSKFGADIFLNRDAWRPTLLSWWSYLGVFVPAFFIILTHPDLGTSMLYFAVVGAMMFMAGLPMFIVLGMSGLALIAGVFAFFTMSHVQSRIMGFFTGGGDDFQVRQSIQSIQHGGLLGSGHDAFIKQSLPDAHTDFVFSAIAEDAGAVGACFLLGLLIYVIKRLITDALDARDTFVFYACGGAAALFGAQVCINIMSALHMMPTKGMTLPFISYGGSSFVAFCLLFGMILAIVREDKWK